MRSSDGGLGSPVGGGRGLQIPFQLFTSRFLEYLSKNRFNYVNIKTYFRTFVILNVNLSKH